MYTKINNIDKCTKKNHGQFEHNEHRGHPVFSFFHFKHKAISYSYIYLLSQTILGKTSVHYAAEKGYKDIIQLFSLHAISSVCDQDEFGKHWIIRRERLIKSTNISW